MSCASESSGASKSPEDVARCCECCVEGGVVGLCAVLLLSPELSRSKMCCCSDSPGWSSDHRKKSCSSSWLTLRCLCWFWKSIHACRVRSFLRLPENFPLRVLFGASDGVVVLGLSVYSSDGPPNAPLVDGSSMWLLSVV